MWAIARRTLDWTIPRQDHATTGLVPSSGTRRRDLRHTKRRRQAVGPGRTRRRGPSCGPLPRRWPTGFRKLVVGRDTWRAVCRVTEDKVVGIREV
ncbi:hypothetical protein FNX44_023680 [Streptomyces sp. OF1]|uniref:Uncharacterized protein n=1 Tax=Streptomyces alkaliterrae TaxID=2213162 RepID=A0A5P0YXT7_9ACTN|nr:hypothetical protein [Streptomyces alkaliterrae]